MAWMTFDGYEVDIYEISKVGIEQADAGLTAGGKERRDFVAGREAWDVVTPWRPLTEIAPLEAYLKSIGWGYGDFWIAPFGDPANTIKARIAKDSWSMAWLRGAPGYVQVTFRVIAQEPE